MREQLTEREEGILLMLAEGMSRPEIAQELHYTVGYLRGMISEMYFKMNAINATHLVALAYHHGILIPKKPKDIRDLR